jgi:hypothetical protein
MTLETIAKPVKIYFRQLLQRPKNHPQDPACHAEALERRWVNPVKE